jgi:hypothetical protein
VTFGLGIIILQGVSRRKSVAGVNIMGIFASAVLEEIRKPSLRLCVLLLFLKYYFEPIDIEKDSPHQT